jgi:outer membrane protein OmpA-like peptidoglycan-associated protein
MRRIDSYYDDDDDGRPLSRVLLGIGVAIALAGAAVLGLRTMASDDSPGVSRLPVSTTDEPVINTTADHDDPTTTVTIDRSAATSTSSPIESDALGDQHVVVSSTSLGDTYATLPDGQPQPVVVVIDTETMAMNGVVPSDAARDRLVSLLTGFGDGTINVEDNLTVDPRVPAGVSVRLILLAAATFPTGSSVIQPQQIESLDYVAALMTLLPDVSVLVVGNSDQVESSPDNLAVSDARARAVVDYLHVAGVGANRLSSRANGGTDVLVDDTSPDSLTVNRRTEFVFTGLLVGV